MEYNEEHGGAAAAAAAAGLKKSPSEASFASIELHLPRRRGRCSSILAKDASDGDFLSPAAAAAAAAPPCSSLYSICARAASSAYQHRPAAAAVHSTYLRYCAKYSPIYKRSCYVNVIEQMHYHVLLPCEQR